MLDNSVTAGHIAVDLGKTTCRLRIAVEGAVTELVGPGAPGFASYQGADRAFAAFADLLEDVPVGVLAQVQAIGIGAAGADADDTGVRHVAEQVRARWGWDVVVTSDVVTAHIGALAGGPGTVLIAGTGAVAAHLDDDGTWTRSDGWGPWLGDEGSGRWLGQTGLIATLRAVDGRGPATFLESDVRELAPDIVTIPQIFTGGHDLARSLASFAPVVLRRAAQGDPVAARIVGRAVDHLVVTAASVTPAGGSVSIVGGLSEDPAFLDSLTARLSERGLVHLPPSGSALDGAAMLAVRHDLIHERNAIRDTSSVAT